MRAKHVRFQILMTVIVKIVFLDEMLCGLVDSERFHSKYKDRGMAARFPGRGQGFLSISFYSSSPTSGLSASKMCEV